MSDLNDVKSALVTAIGAAMYPNGTGQASATGTPTKIYPGWPNDIELDADLKAGTVHISVDNLPGVYRDVTRYMRKWMVPTQVAPTITASVNGLTATLAGTITAGNYATLIAGNQVSSYAVTANDTLSTIATALAGGFKSPVTATANGAAITITAGSATLIARTAAPQTGYREVQRQQVRLMVTVWAANNAQRAAAAAIVNQTLCNVVDYTLPDGFTAHLEKALERDTDREENRLLYRRDICFDCEFPTTVTQPEYPVTSVTTTVQGSNPLGQVGQSATVVS